MGNNREFYEKDGRQYQRITHILDYFPPPWLVDWKLRVGKKEARRVSTVALKIGDNVDEVVKAIAMGIKAPRLKTPEAKSAYEGFSRWLDDYSPTLSIPDTVFSDELGVAGTPDLVWGDIVVDLKCSAYISPSYWLQTEFYGRCLGVSNKAILRLDKNLGNYEFQMKKLSENDWMVVKSLVNVYYYYNKESE